MNRSTLARGVVPAALVLSLALAACGSDDAGSDDTSATTGGSTAGSQSEAEELSGTLNGAGSSAQQAAQEAWVAGFSDSQPDVTVNYQPVGSGAGREQFLAGAVDFAGSDAALKDEEITSAESVCPNGIAEFPVYVSPIAVAFNLPDIDTLNLTPDTIAGIFSGAITTWDAPEIAESNPDAQLPSTAITPVHRSDESGTTQNFTDYLSKAAPDVWTEDPAQTWPEGFGGESAQGTSGVVSAIQAGEGYVGYADASQIGELGTAAVGVGDTFTELSPEAAAAVLDSSERVEGRGDNDIAISVARDTTDEGVYPIVLVSYAITCDGFEDEEKGALVAAYLEYITSEEGQSAAADNAGSAPITESLRGDITPIIESIRSGGTAGGAGAGASDTESMESMESMESSDITPSDTQTETAGASS